MVNYYKQFEVFKKEYKLKSNDRIPLEKFKHHMMMFFGFSLKSHHGNKTVEQWLTNFEEVGFIKLKKDRNVMDNDDNCWMVSILNGENVDGEVSDTK